MATGLFDYGKHFLLDLTFGGTVVVPATWYVALLRTLPAEEDTGLTIDEPWFTYPEVGEDPGEEPDGDPDPVADVPTGYARAAVTNNDTNWPDAQGGLKWNAVAVEFPVATQNWDEIVGLAIVDASTGGNAVLWVELSEPLEVTMGNAPVFDAETLVLSAGAPEDPFDPMNDFGEGA